MTKFVIGVLSVALLGTGVLVGVAGGLDSEPARSVSLPGSTTGDDTTTGTTTTGATTFGVVTTGTTATAAATTLGDDREDNSGAGSGDDHDNDDRSGSNSGGG